MKPSSKSIPMSDFLEAFSGRTTAITGNVCIPKPLGCGGPATTFNDELSRREYTISGLCQSCQDLVFQEPEEDH